MAAPTFYKSRTSFATIIDGRPVVVKQGELVREGDPLLERREQLFDKYEPESRFDQLANGARSRYEPAPEPDFPVGLTEDPTPRVEPNADGTPKRRKS
jgi:hypothetical protein